MAVARDGTPAVGSVNGGDSFTITLSTTGTNRLILVGVHQSNSSVTNTTPTASGLTFAQVGTTQTGGGTTTQLWRAFATAQLTSTVITVSATPTGNFPQQTGWAVGYSGTDTTGANGAGAIDVVAGNASVTSTSYSQAITTVTNNALCIALGGEANVFVMTAGTNQTKIQQTNNAGSSSAVGLFEQNAVTSPAGSVTMNYTLATTAPGGIIAVGIKPAAAVSNPSFKVPVLRPAIFKPGLAR